MWSRICVLLIGAVSLASTGCKNDNPTEANDVIGHWEVVSAERDGRVTETLNGAYFVLSEDGSMRTNVTGSEDSGTYSMDRGELHFDGNESAMYQIGDFSDSTMRLSVELRGYQFQLTLERKTEE